MKRFIVTFMLTIILCTTLLGVYKLGVYNGEQHTIENMHIMDIEQDANGSYDVVILYKSDEYLHVWNPYWRAQMK